MNRLFNLAISSSSLYLLVFIASLILSAIANYHAVANPDGILYLRAAEIFNEQGLKAAMEIFPWPFYSVLIATAHKLTTLNYQNAALLLNSLLLAMMAICFVDITKRLGGNLRIQQLAAIIILLLPTLADYRDYFIRDSGYWPFLLLGLTLFLRFNTNLRWLTAISMGMSLCIAALFRFEGIVVLILTPLLLLILQQEEPILTRIGNATRCYAFPLLLAVAWGIVIVATGKYHLLGRLPELIEKFVFLFALPEHWQAQRDLLLTLLPEQAKPDEATTLLLGGFSVYFLVKLLQGLSFIGALLVVYALITNSLPRTTAVRLTLGFFIINLIIPIVFLAQFFFLSERYVMPAVWILLLAAPFGLAHGLDHMTLYSKLKQRTIKIILSLCVIYLLIESTLSFGPSPYYLRQAGEWLAINTPATSRVLTNHGAINYYNFIHANKWQPPVSDEQLQQQLLCNTLQDYDYIALRVPRKQADFSRLILQQPPGKILVEFANNKNDRVIIFQQEP